MYIEQDERWIFDGAESIKGMHWNRLSQVIELISREIDEYCNTRFEPAADRYSLDFCGKFHTRRRPLIEVSEMSLNGVSLAEGRDYFVYPESARVEVAAPLNGGDKKALEISYLFGYIKPPATVKQVIVELIKLDMEAKSFKAGGLQSENWDGEYSYPAHSSKDMTPAGLRKNILARLDIFKEEPYTEPRNTRTVIARIV